MKKRVISALLAAFLACSVFATAVVVNAAQPTSSEPSASSTVEETSTAPAENTQADQTASESTSSAPADNTASSAPAENTASSAPAENTDTDQAASESASSAPSETPAGDATYTASAKNQDGQSVNVIVDVPEGAFADGVKPVLHAKAITDKTELDKTADALKQKDDTSFDGMVALDVYFTNGSNTEEIEPAKQVSVRFEMPQTALPDDIDPSTLTVHHLDETGGAVDAQTVATTDTKDSVKGIIALSDEAAAQTKAAADVARLSKLSSVPATVEQSIQDPAVVAEFDVKSFSTFTITWGSSRAINVTCYDAGTNQPLPNGTAPNNITLNSGDAIQFDSTNSKLAINGYTFDHATYRSGTYGQYSSLTSLAASRSYGGIWRYTINNGNPTTSQPTINLYYKQAQALGTVSTADTSGTVNISLFDYNYRTVNQALGGTSGNQAFYFAGDGGPATASSNSSWSHWTGKGGGVFQGIVQNTLNSNGNPLLNRSYNQNLDVLFDPSSYNTSYTGLNHLFTYDSKTGYYSFDSSKNFATIKNPNGEGYNANFTVYNQPNTGTSSGASGHPYFLPFNDFGQSENGADYHFGMKITTDFLMPKDGKINDKDMMFSFAGDDDVWVFIDGVLVLDMGGIHESNSGSINFGTGIVSVPNVTNSSIGTSAYIGDLLHAAKSSDSEWIAKNLEQRSGHWYLKDYSQHSLSFFYLERGAVDSNCKIEFNLYTLQQHSIYVGKQLSAYNGTDDVKQYLNNIEYKFRVLKAGVNASTTNPDDLFIPAGTKYQIFEGNEQTGIGTVGENGIFTVKAGQYAVFPNISEDSGEYYVQELMDKDYSAQFGDVAVSVTPDGGTTGFQDNQGITIDPVTFEGAISGTMDPSGGTSTVTFTNKVDTTKLSTLSIEKEVLPGSDFNKDQEFTVNVTMGGDPVAAGTTYQLYDGNNSTTATVTTAGQIQLKAGQRAVFTVLTGTEFTISEQNGANYHANFTATQQFSGTKLYKYTLTSTSDTTNGTTVSGTVGDLRNTDFGNEQEPADGTGASMAVTLTNSNYDFAASLNISKTLQGYTDSNNYTFNFDVVQVDEKGNPVTTPNANATISAPSITIDSADKAKGATGTIYFGYKTGIEDDTYYYKVSENSGNVSGMHYDSNYYIVTVQVAGGKATIKSVTKYADGKQVDGYTWSNGDALPFVNSLSSQLTVSKTVDGNGGDKKKDFRFTLTVTGAQDQTIDYDTIAKTIQVTPLDEDESQATYTFTNGSVTFSLHDGQQMTVTLPYGCTYQVSEQADGYNASVNVTGDNDAVINNVIVSGTMDADINVAYTNKLTIPVPSGIEDNHTPYVIMVTATALAGSALIVGVVARHFRRRRREE